MNEVEHYALSLVFYCLIGFQIGVGNSIVEAVRAGDKKPYDLLTPIGYLPCYFYAYFGLRFLDGGIFSALIALLLFANGHMLGTMLATARDERAVVGFIFAAFAAVPLIYHFVLT